jgi:hypothetical protein
LSHSSGPKPSSFQQDFPQYTRVTQDVEGGSVANERRRESDERREMSVVKSMLRGRERMRFFLHLTYLNKF